MACALTNIKLQLNWKMFNFHSISKLSFVINANPQIGRHNLHKRFYMLRRAVLSVASCEVASCRSDNLTSGFLFRSVPRSNRAAFY